MSGAPDLARPSFLARLSTFSFTLLCIGCSIVGGVVVFLVVAIFITIVGAEQVWVAFFGLLLTVMGFVLPLIFLIRRRHVLVPATRGPKKDLLIHRTWMASQRGCN